MPEYLAPGVYVEETSFRAKSIEGVGTSTTAFVGPTRKGPLAIANGTAKPELLTSFGDFVRIYGGLEPLSFASAATPTINYLANAVLNFFNEGGARLYVARVGGTLGTASITLTSGSDSVAIKARFGGHSGNGTVIVQEQLAPAPKKAMDKAPVGTLVRVVTGSTAALYVKGTTNWTNAAATTLDLSGIDDAEQPGDSASFVRLSILAKDCDSDPVSFEDLEFAATLPLFVGKVLCEAPSLRASALLNAFWFDIPSSVGALALHGLLFPSSATGTVSTGLNATHILTGGTDGAEPTLGAPTDTGTYAAAFAQLLALEDISIVAAPGHSAYGSYAAVQGALISHAETPRAYRVAILDTPPNTDIGSARDERAKIDSKYAALYYPWVTVANPLARAGSDAPKEIDLPPSGFLAGIYARNDVERGVAKAPANEVVRGALRFATDVNHAQNQLLNPLGVNCLRFFPGRGYRVWGARTASSDPEWKYINVRRYFLFLESSVDRGTQWAVFENNGERLWANIRETIEAFLYNEWVSGNLLGASPKEAFFVRCDRSTMTQNDLDNGRLICLVGVAALKPAEFVVFRIGQKTADARS